MGERAEQDDDPRGILALVHQLPQPARQAPRLRHLRSGARVVREARQLGLLGLPSLAVVHGQQELHRRRTVRLIDERGERLEAGEQAAPDRVGRGDQPGRRPEVPGQGKRHPVGLISLLEPAVLLAVDLDVRVAEAVDRLELVADEEQARIRAAQLLDQPQLEAVRVLELVDHEVGELLAVAISQGL